MEVNLKCGKCKAIYNFEVGNVTLDEEMSLVFEKETVCPNCGVKGEDLLSELGQSQMTELFLRK